MRVSASRSRTMRSAPPSSPDEASCRMTVSATSRTADARGLVQPSSTSAEVSACRLLWYSRAASRAGGRIRLGERVVGVEVRGSAPPAVRLRGSSHLPEILDLSLDGLAELAGDRMKV